MRGRRAGLLLPVLLLAAAASGCASAEPANAGTAAPVAPAAPDAPAKTELVVEFAGNESFGASELRRRIEDDLEDFEQRGRRKSAADDAAYSLELHYLENGFPFVKVVPEFQPQADGTVHVLFRIDEGPRTVIRELRLRGNQRFPDDELRDLFRGPSSGALGTGRTYFVQGNLEAGVSAIVSVYWSAGYLQAEVDPPRVVFSDDRASAEVAINIREGTAFTLVRIDLAGRLDVPEEELRAELSGYVGKPYFPQVAYAARARLLEFYGDRGHPDATVAFTEARDERDGHVTLAFTIDPGPVVTVGEVHVRGVERTDEQFILERLKLQPGETWSRSDERASFADLYRSGLFRTVSITLEPGPGERRDVDVDLAERESREIYIEPGYGSYEGPRITMGYRDLNIFGNGRIFHTEGSLSGKAQRALVGLTDPWFLKDFGSADVSLFFNHRDEPSFTRNELGVATTLTRQHTPRWQSQWGYSYRRSRISNVDVVDAEVQSALDDVDISAISYTPSYESRDDAFAPKRGTSMRTSIEWGDGVLGSELDFTRVRYGQSWYVPVGRGGGVLATSFRTGAIVPHGSTDVIPLQERFFNGGENTVRSFREDELGPTDDKGNPIGGEAYSVFSIELRHPLEGNLDGALFIDAGNVVEQYSDYFRFTGFASAVGVGLRYMLPVGPVRLDLGVNPAPRSGEDNWVVHLSVGMPF